ncbi:EAL domain-containing protein [Teichococcus wenyumeiae]|uniref:EAL domain-containing protein n=1 Tax=Teichococcus wenyumeiae TaxID=2478470 RepID=UPI002279D6CF|nr:EAL domain-containing protein [Pseudoroseomonas wenyumeiae]
MDEACRRWRNGGARGCACIGVNLFGEQLRAGDLPDIVTAALARRHLPTKVLELELKENIAVRQDEGVLAALHALRDRGIAIDDFGTGFASLVTLQNVPVTRLKIDRSFITHVAEEAHDAAIVEAALTLARKLGLRVIAEGVETEAQESLLRARGCAEGLGFRYGRALPPAELLAASWQRREDGAPIYPLAPAARQGHSPAQGHRRDGGAPLARA